MSEKRFIVESVEIFECCEFDKRIVKAITDKNELYTYSDIYEIADLLNEQQSIIDKLDQENADLLGSRIKAQEEWEKCTDKLKEKIVEQQAIIEALKRENDKLYHWKSNDTLKEPVTYESKEECSVELEKGVPL